MRFPMMLLTTFLLALAQLKYSVAHPTHAMFVTIPITRTPPAGDNLNIHPAIVHQQHVNRGIARLGLMKGHAGPTHHQLWTNIQNRLTTLPADFQTKYNDTKRVDGTPIDETQANSSNVLMAANAPPEGHNSEVASEDGGITKSRTPTIPNSIGLNIQANDVGYIGTIQIGTPLRDFQLLMDSGSADLWVGAEKCRNDNGGGCGDHAFLGHNSSSSFNDTKKEWSIQYGTGAVSGHIVHDNVKFANLELKAFRFGAALNETDDFTSNDIPFDGLVGLAKSVVSQQGGVTLVEALQQAGLIKDAITSYKIPRRDDGKHDGELTLGAMDPSKFNHQTLVTIPNVNPLGFWEAEIDAIKINGIDMGWTNRTAILDTGTTLIIAPQKDVDAIHKAIPGAKFDGTGWTIPCTTKTSFSLAFGRRAFSVDPRDLVFLPVDPKDQTGDCTSVFSQGNVGPADEWLVGDVFLKNVYLSTNVGKNQISLAKLAN